MRVIVAACAIAVLAAGCSGLTSHDGAALPAISADRPPSPSTWPAYPKFSTRSCWGRPGPATDLMRGAPSVSGQPHATPPRLLAQELLAHFGDRSLIRGVRIGPRPSQRGHPYRPRKDPPRDGLWAYIDAPPSLSAGTPPRTGDPTQLLRSALGEWEIDLFFGALRDDFCRAGGRPLVGYSVHGNVIRQSTNEYAFNQRFPNPSRARFRARLAAAAKRYGFRPVSARLLRPRELAPIVVVETDRDRKEFIEDVPEIRNLLDPQSHSKHHTAVTFEGLFLEARDERGPFVMISEVYRGHVAGSQWSAEPDAYPYEHG
ncbi:MAG TPA: hypothetical protein VH420_03260 [Gaiellaceae bacterium]